MLFSKKYIYISLVFAFFLFLALNRHSKSGVFGYHSELWADQSGYNVYLPALFIYDFKAKNFPGSIALKTGSGFEIDLPSDKVKTKYSYGVALLQSPFWLIAHFLAKDKSGYSLIYHKSIDFAAAFYFTVGLWFLYAVLKKYANRPLVLVSIVLILIGTNTLYYAIFETGMSHIYSFAMFSVLLFLLQKKDFDTNILWIGMLIFLLRPINLLFLLPTILFFDTYSWEDFRTRFFKIATFKNSILAIFIFLLGWFPQICYYYYMNGTWRGGYDNEHFDYLYHPKLLEVMFSPDNGLFLYAPLLLCLLIFLVFTKKNNIYALFLPFVLVLLYVFLYGSWWSYMLGCGFGHRGFVDIMPIFAVSLCFVLQSKQRNWFILPILLCAVYTTKLTFTYSDCLWSTDDWNWQSYVQLLFGKLK
jgi:hypothetical protein